MSALKFTEFQVQLADIRTDGGTQSRAAINAQIVADYAEAIKLGDVFPPVVVFFDGADYWLADGFHRYEAHASAGSDALRVDLRQGTRRDAVLFSVGANALHGLRRTNDDKRRAVLTLLNDAEWQKWPQTKIAQVCGVSQAFVSRLVVAEQPVSYFENKIRSVERNGATYEQNTAKIGKREPKPEPAPQVELRVIETPAVEAAPEPKPEIDSKERRKLAKLSPEAMIEEIAALRADLADEKAKSARIKSERDDLAERLAEALGGDQGKTIGNLQKQLRAVKYARDEAMTEAKRMEYRMKKAEARVADLEKMGIAV